MMRRVYTDTPLLVVDIDDSDSGGSSSGNASTTSGSGRQTPEQLCGNDSHSHHRSSKHHHHRPPPKPEKPLDGSGPVLHGASGVTGSIPGVVGPGGRYCSCASSCCGLRRRALCSLFCVGQKGKMLLRQLRKLLDPKNLFVINFMVLLINLFFLVMQMKQGFWPVETYFQPVLSTHDKAVMMTTMKACFHALTAANITVFMYGGTLIGSYRHHGFIPWDDDVDIIVNGSEKERVVDVLTKLGPNYKLYYGGDSQAASPWKFYSDEIHSKFIHKPFKWPYVDMFFFWENATHIFDEKSNAYSFHKSKVFPLVRRPFMDAVFPAPCNTKSVLDNNYVIELCRSRSFSHMMEVPMFTFSTQDVPCERLANYFPFVYRSGISQADGSLNETLRMSQWNLSSISLPGVQCTGVPSLSPLSPSSLSSSVLTLSPTSQQQQQQQQQLQQQLLTAPSSPHYPQPSSPNTS